MPRPHYCEVPPIQRKDDFLPQPLAGGNDGGVNHAQIEVCVGDLQFGSPGQVFFR